MTLNSSIHKNILVQILIDIYSDTTIGPYLGFKGGTAAYLFYELERFSVDLDFDLLDESKETYVFEQVEKILKKYGVIKEAQVKRFNLLFLLAYDNKEKNAQNVKIVGLAAKVPRLDRLDNSYPLSRINGHFTNFIHLYLHAT